MKTLRTFFSATSLLTVLTALLFTGCGGSGTQDSQANQEAADTIAKEVTLTPEQHSLLYTFPTPFEVTMMLEKAKAGYIFDITNSPSKVDNYGTEFSKALNLGVYSADLSYSATYNRPEETGQFLNVTKKLADELGIAGVYDQSLLDRVKKYNNNKDSLVGMINQVLSSTNEFLSKNNRNQIAVLIATGGFVEGMFLAASLNEVAKDNHLIANVILEQKPTLEKLMTILGAYQNDTEMLKVSADISKLEKIYSDYGLEPDKKVPMQKAAEIADLAESVRMSFTR